ncbi:MAG: YDG domain-containing protein, partial [Bacteroidales bacterium]|nr:YDG domain-containing protein [Bacteroidales bacterium]
WQTGGTFSSLDPNTSYNFYARLAEDANHNPSPASAALTVITDKATLTGTPAIDNTTPQYLDVLSVNTAGLSADVGLPGTLSYRWKSDGTNISGATNASYTIQASDIGKQITVEVTAANCQNAVTSTATGAVAKRTVAATDLQFSLTAVDYSGSAQSVSVTGKSGIVGLGTTITVKYDAGTEAPANAGNYAVTVDITAGDNYAAATGLLLGNFTINPIAPTADLLDYDLTTVSYDGSSKPVSVTANSGVNGLGTITAYYEGVGGIAYPKSSTAPTDAGTYAVTVSIAAGTNYLATTTDLSLGNFIIDGINIPVDASNIVITPYNADYDGLLHGISVTDNGGGGVGGTVTYCATQDGIYGPSSPTFTDAGAYTVYFKVARTGGNYNIYSGSAAVNIDKKSLSGATVTLSGSPFTYTGNQITPGIASVTVNGVDAFASDYEVSYGVNVTVAQGGSVTVTAKTDGNFSGSENTTFVIDRAAAPSVTWPSASAITYGAELSTSTLTGGSTEYGSFAWTTSATVPTVVNSGYNVTFTQTDTKNYQSVSPNPQPVSITVNPKPVTLSGLLATNRAYDGTNVITIQGTPTLNGKVGNDDLSLSINTVTATADTKDVGNNKPVTVVSGYSLSGSDAGNYTLEQPELTVNITAKSISISGVSATNREYDRTTSVTLAGGTLVGVETVDVASVTFTLGVGTMTNKSAGTGKDVTTNITLTGAGATNYTLTQPAYITVDIAAKAVTITGLTAQNKEYDGTTAAIATGGTLSGVISGDQVSISAGTAAFSDKTVNTGKTVTFSGYDITGTDVGNYALSAQPANSSADITAKSVTITGLSATNRAYDGTNVITIQGTPTLTGKVGNDDLSLSINAVTATADTKDVGNNKPVTVTGYTLSGSDAANYTLTAQPAGLNVNITAKSIGISGVAATNREYDRTTSVALAGGSLVGVESVDASVTFILGVGTMANKIVGTGKDVTTNITLTGAGATNYTLTQPAYITVDIAVKAVTITGLTAQDKAYDGTTTATTTGGALSGVISGDIVTITAGTATFASSAIGNNITVSFSGYGIAGADAGNYILSAQPASVTANITQSIYGVSIGSFANGSVSADKTSAQAGETVTLTVYPNSGYELENLNVYQTNSPYTPVGSLHATSSQEYEFTMPAYGVTVTATFRKTADQQAVEDARYSIENTDWNVAQTTANTQSEVRTWLANQIGSLLNGTGISVSSSNITVSNFYAATAGSAGSPAGVNGRFDFTVSLSKGYSSETAGASGTITATAYTPPATYGITVATTTNGTVTASPSGPAQAGTLITLTVTPDQGYEINDLKVLTNPDNPATAVETSHPTSLQYTFTMPARAVTVTATFRKTQAQLDRESVEAARAAIEGGAYRVAQATANDATTVRTWLVNTLNILFGQSYDIELRSATPVAGDITVTTFTSATEGTESNPAGVNGSFGFTVGLAKGASIATATVMSGVIVATPHAMTPVKRIELLPGNLTVRILNTGNVVTGDLTLTLSGANADAFTLSSGILGSLPVGGETDITLIPRITLTPGTYTSTLTVSAEGMTPVSVEITYVVTPTGIDVPQAQTLKAFVIGGILHVTGLVPDEFLSIYNMQGQLFRHEKATATEKRIHLRERGIYVVVSGSRTVKVVY